MSQPRSAVVLLVLGIPWVSYGSANAQKTAPLSSGNEHVLYLNGKPGQHVAARVGQAIQMTLQTVGPGRYSDPQISSSAIRFESVAFAKEQIPAGPRQVYRFRAVSKGEAEVKIPHTDRNPTFVIAIRVYERRKP